MPMKKIFVRTADKQWEATLNDSVTASEIYRVLPIKGLANLWGDEIYFSLPISVDLEEGAMEEVEPGTLAYWPPGNAFCIFFGPTPASTSSMPKAASQVNIIGNIVSGFRDLKSVELGALIEITID